MLKSLILFLFPFWIFSTDDLSEKPDRVTVSFSKDQAIAHPFIGHGVQWSAYPHADAEDAEWGDLMTDDKWDLIYDRLDFINPKIVRVMDVASWRYFKGLDASGQAIIEYDNGEMRSLYKLLDYCQKNKIPILLGEWGTPGFWEEPKTENGIHLANDDRWLDMIAQFVRHLIVEKGFDCIKYYNLVNEPNGNWASTDGDWEQWKEGYKEMADVFKKYELDQYISLAGPDGVVQWNHPTHPKKAGDWLYSTAEELDGITSVYDIHIYADQHLTSDGNLIDYLTPFAEAVQSSNKPIILGELGMKYTGELWKENQRRGQADNCAGPDDSNMFIYDYSYGLDMADAAVQSMLAGFGGATAWHLDDAMHTVGDKGGKDQLKKWGMWNTLGEEICGDRSELELRPWSYTWTLMCNLFTPGVTMVRPDFDAATEDKEVRAVAAFDQKNFTAMLVNRSSEAKAYSITSDVLDGSKTLYSYEYTDGERSVNSSGFPVPVEKKKWDAKTKKMDVMVQPNSAYFISTIKID
ncbi:MAG: cellulase family glycosylhydrolase [Bacteroidota bacterium]